MYDAAATGVSAPSAQAREVFSELCAKADNYLTQLKVIIATDLKVFNDIARKEEVPVIILSK